MAQNHTVRVPAAHAVGILETLLAIYAGHADALAARVRAYRDSRESLATVMDARRDLIEAEGSLDALGWQLGPRASDVELAGPAGGVREILYRALLRAASSAPAACRNYEGGRIDRSVLAATITELTVLHELFEALEEADAPDPS